MERSASTLRDTGWNTESRRRSRPWWSIRPTGESLALTEQAKQKAAQAKQAKQGHGPNESWEDQSLYDRCISRGVMGSILPVIYNNGNADRSGPRLRRDPL